MEEILSKLLVPDSKTIREGTKELKEAFRTQQAIPSLCGVLVFSSHPQIRQYAAVLLRRKLGKKRQWRKLNLDMRTGIKRGMLKALVIEQEKMVKNSIAQFIGTIGKHEFPDNSWPEILQCIHNLTSSETIMDKELGMYTLSIMTEVSQSSFIVHAESFAILCANMLNQLPELQSDLAYYTVMTMKNLVPVIEGHQQIINIYQSLLPKILEIINSSAQVDEKKTCDMLEIMEELTEYAVSAIVPHIRLLIEMCFQLASNTSMPKSIRIKSVSVVGWLVRWKGKVVLKNQLVEPIIDFLMFLMAQQPKDEGNEEYFLGDPDQFTCTTIASQALDMIALHIPAQKVVPYILAKVEPAIQGTDIYAQKAAYLALASLAEGCSESLKHKYLESILRCVCSAIHNPNTVVRNAAFFALGQFAEYLQPEISRFSTEILPVLFECLGQILTQMDIEKKDPPSLNSLFYALQTFCENLKHELLPYLPTLMDRLFVALDPNRFSLLLRRAALSTLGSVACAVKKDMLPYFEKIIKILNLYISSDPDSEVHQLQSYAIDTLAVVAQHIGPRHFKPLASESLQLGLRLLDETSDPDIKKSVYSLFASLALVIKEEIDPYLPKIVNEMIESIQSSEGIVTHYEDEGKDDVDVFAELSDDENVEEDIGDSLSGSEEKEQACVALREICLNAGIKFLPYIEKCFEEIFKLMDYPNQDIQKVSIVALLQFCITLNKCDTPEGKQALHKALQMFVPKCGELIHTDGEPSVVTACLDAYTTLLAQVKGEVFVGEGHREAVMNCVIDVLNLKTMCQNTDLGEAIESNDEDAEVEHDEILRESAGGVIPKFAFALGPTEFVSYFPNILQLFSMRTKKQNSEGQRSFAFAVLADCMKSLDVYVEKFVPTLLQLWLTGARDPCEGVRNNAICGLGEMILHGKDRIFGNYTEILQALSTAVATETDAGTLDNICGALGKMILLNPNGIPLPQVFSAFLQKLPLRTDFGENEAIIKCFYSLYRQGNPVLKQHLLDVIKIAVHIYKKNQAPRSVRRVLINFIKIVNSDFPEEFGHALSSFEPTTRESIHKLFFRGTA